MLAAVRGPAIENLVAHAPDDVDPPCPIDGDLRLLRLVGSRAAGQRDRMAGLGRGQTCEKQ